MIGTSTGKIKWKHKNAQLIQENREIEGTRTGAAQNSQGAFEPSCASWQVGCQWATHQLKDRAFKLNRAGGRAVCTMRREATVSQWAVETAVHCCMTD